MAKNKLKRTFVVIRGNRHVYMLYNYMKDGVLYLPLALNYDFMARDYRANDYFGDIPDPGYEELARIVSEHIVEPLEEDVVVETRRGAVYLVNYTLDTLPLETLGALLWLNDKGLDALRWFLRDIEVMVVALERSGFCRMEGDKCVLLVDRDDVLEQVYLRLGNILWEHRSVFPLVYYFGEHDRFVEAYESTEYAGIPDRRDMKRYYIYMAIARDYAPRLLLDTAVLYGVLLGSKFSGYRENRRDVIEMLAGEYLRGNKKEVVRACYGKYGLLLKLYLQLKGVCWSPEKILDVAGGSG